jgi:hypothetical protein
MLPNVLQHVLPDWVASFEDFLRENLGAVPSRGEFERLAFQQLLTSDLRVMGRSTLPPDMGVQALQGQVLRGPHLLQVEDWRDTGRPMQQGDGLVDVEADVEDAGEGEPIHGMRAKKEAPAGPNLAGKRLLKLVCSGDSSRRVEAFEYRYCGDLNANALRKGCKVLVQNVLVLRGMLALTPASLRVLGGAWQEEPPPAPPQQQAARPGPETNVTDELDIDIEAFEAMERAALAQRQQRQQQQQQTQQRLPQPKQEPAPPTPPPPIRKKSRKKFLDDDDE